MLPNRYELEGVLPAQRRCCIAEIVQVARRLGQPFLKKERMPPHERPPLAHKHGAPHDPRWQATKKDATT